MEINKDDRLRLFADVLGKLSRINADTDTDEVASLVSKLGLEEELGGELRYLGSSIIKLQESILSSLKKESSDPVLN